MQHWEEEQGGEGASPHTGSCQPEEGAPPEQEAGGVEAPGLKLMQSINSHCCLNVPNVPLEQCLDTGC